MIKMLALGNYRFSVDNAAFTQFKQSREWNWQAQSRINNIPSLHYTGKNNDQIDLSGTIYPHYKGGLDQINAMANEADKAVPLALIDGLGKTHGLWIIIKIDETKTHLNQQGVPLKIDFNDTEEKQMKQLIQAVWAKIKNLDLPDISNYSDDYKGAVMFIDSLL